MGIRAISPKRRADFSIAASEGTVLTGCFNERELEIFAELIKHRQQLPVFHGDFWRCYECVFESDRLEEMAIHIMKYHKPVSRSIENKLKQELAAV